MINPYQIVLTERTHLFTEDVDMSDNSSSSSSSMSSSSSGEEESPLALQEAIESNLLDAANVQEYQMGDTKVKRAGLEESMRARQMLINERARSNGTRPLVSNVNLTGNF